MASSECLKPARGSAASLITEQHSLSYPNYRPDIDGLRGIAVLLVVAYHAFPSWMKSGFIGVDIFFVISGFLINSIIFKNLEKDSFSYVEFYSRRINRILPALILILASSYAFGWLALYADEYSELSKHILAGVGFVSNFLLWSETGYFDNPAYTKPLLHLWSLGIEEQFYIFWPLMLGVMFKYRNNFLTVTILIAAASFAINMFTILDHPDATFYSPVTRIWELMLGGILAYKPWLTRFSQLQSAIGLLLIIAGVLMVDRYTPFPGWRALLPTVGVVLIISSPSAWLNQYVLGHRLLVWTGLISYPLYLWHWPLLSFARIIEGGYASGTARIAALAGSGLLAIATYRLIEKPIRFGRNNKTSSIVLVVLLLLVGALGLLTVSLRGIPERLPDNLQNIAQLGTNITASVFAGYQRDSTAQKLFGSDFRPDRDFFISEGKFSEARILVIGDSHSNRLYAGLSGIGLNNIANIGRGTCLPFVSTNVKSAAGWSNYCQPLFDNIFKYIKENDKIEVVIINAFFNQYRDGRMVPVTTKGRQDKNSDVFIEQLNGTLDLLEEGGKKIIIALDVPEIKGCRYKRSFPLNTTDSVNISDCTLDLANLRDESGSKMKRELAASKKHKNVYIFDPSIYLCDETKCGNISNKQFYLSDGNHLSIDGAKTIAQHLLAAIN